jgi:hypothetical protein
MKRGTLGVTVSIVPPDAKFPDKVDLSGLPVFEYQPPLDSESESRQVQIDEPKTEESQLDMKPTDQKITNEPITEQESQGVEPITSQEYVAKDKVTGSESSEEKKEE